MLTDYVALKCVGHPLRKQNQREPLAHTQAEHLHQQMCLEELERENCACTRCLAFSGILLISSTDLALFLYIFF